jgi:acyl-CoA hydrolase
MYIVFNQPQKGGLLLDCKHIGDSAVVMSTVMQPNQANPAGNVHGGEIMKLMDNAAYVVAHRHARTNVVTARVDELTFHLPITVGNLVTCHAYLTFVGRSSMEVAVTVEVENLYSEAPAKCALTAYFTMVALNPGGAPARVPTIELLTDEEKQRFEEGRRRYELNKQKPRVCIPSPYKA